MAPYLHVKAPTPTLGKNRTGILMKILLAAVYGYVFAVGLYFTLILFLLALSVPALIVWAFATWAGYSDDIATGGAFVAVFVSIWGYFQAYTWLQEKWHKWRSSGPPRT